MFFRTSFIFFTLLCLFACNETEKLPAVKIMIKGVEFSFEVARSREEQAKGLMFREEMGRHEGMLFLYTEYTHGPFWMKNTLLPLSIAFLDREGTVITLADMKPKSERLIRSERPYLYALEVNQGVFGELGLKPGDKIKLPF
ncbi:MAG: DUF192 domain-containing protein [Spirochaetales bacterium]|nr:DUF192 domain-containing protein [Spirochaetales bacterium]